ncbi:MAG: c-type cytochrome [Fuerstiella sp.]|nr:c-type cytochrome [Fuerstiella sp.]
MTNIFRTAFKRPLLQAATIVFPLSAAFLLSVAPAQEITERTPWTMSRIVGSPEPPPPLKQTLRFPNLKFDQPLYLERDPDNSRLWVITREGAVFSFPDDREVSEPDLFVELAQVFDQLTPHESAKAVRNAYGLAFHPQYPEVPVCWLTYNIVSGIKKTHLEDGTRLSRFNVVFDNKGVPRCDIASEKIVLTWPEGGHNGACLQFGPDGYLYISAGDGEVPNPPDPRRAGQDVTSRLSTIMRIDVNPTDDGPLYTVPADNPFVKAANNDRSDDGSEQFDAGGLRYSFDEALPEIWAYGFRNPWKMNFGPDGQLWVGDVGWELYEMVYNVKPGGNYGWSIVEGPHTVIPDGKRGPTPIVAPAVAYSHAEGASVTGGFVYQGSQFPELKGRYIFGDYETRRIWSATITKSEDESADSLTDLTDLVDPSVRIVAFGEDTSDELLLLHFDEGRIYGLERNEAVGEPSAFPRLLSETGLFSDVGNQVPNPGVIPVEINAPMWNDGATAVRWLGVPGTEPIQVLPGPKRMQESSLRESMHFPTGSVLARTVTIEKSTGYARVALETQVLQFNGKTWAGYSYLWNTDQTDAELVPAGGVELQLSDYDKSFGKATWHVHSRSECIRCHNSWAGGVLGFTLSQLNRPVQFIKNDAGQTRRSHHGHATRDAAVTTELTTRNQIEWLRNIGLLSGQIPDDARNSTDPRVAALSGTQNTEAPLEHRARSYLSVNCAHCHQRGAGGTATIDLRHEASLAETKMIDAIPVQGTFQIPGGAIVSPGKPSHSVLVYRTTCSGRGRMPHIGSRKVDVNGVNMLRAWVSSLPSDGTSVPITASLQSTPQALEVVARLDRGDISDDDRTSLLADARNAAPEIHNLFTRFQPQAYRQQLNRRLDAAHLLSMEGNAAKGAALFTNKRFQCITCHRIGKTGGQIGPALDDTGKRLKAGEILAAILDPSQKIDPKFAAWTALTIDGAVHSGLLVHRTASDVTLRTVKNENIVIPRTDLEELIQQTVSLMPDRLLNDLTDEQIADLLAFLSAQK